MSLEQPSITTHPRLLAEELENKAQEAPYELIDFAKVYNHLNNGDAVDIAASGRIFLQIDEENLGLERVTLENLQKRWETDGENFTNNLKEHGIDVDPFTVYKWYNIQRKVFETLGKPYQNEHARSMRLAEHNNHIKLSETKGYAMCSEYATLSAYIAQKIGEPVHLVVGSAVSDETEWREAHAFLWVDGLNAIYDGVQAEGSNEYPALMIPKTPVPFEALETGLDVEAKRIDRNFWVHYGLEAGGFGVTSAHKE